MPGPPTADALPDPGTDLLRQDNAVRALGIVIEVSAVGRAEATLRPTADMGNGHGVVHGGLVFALADTAFAYALNSHGRPGVSVHADVTYLAPAQVGGLLRAVAVEREFDGRSGIYDVDVRDDRGTLLAAVRVHGRIPSTTKA